jgi:CMP-N,N'-diacetyllegionaminic acid synthase
VKILGIILARSGSKRILNKNTNFLGNIRLFEWTLNQCNRINFITDFLVSTDNKLIFEEAKKKKFIVPWLRPKKLCTDKSTSYSACAHALKWYEKKVQTVDGIFLFQVTSPFRTKKNITDGIKAFIKYKKPVLSVTEVLNHNFNDEKKNFIIKNNNIILKRDRNNQKKKKFTATGSIYIWPKKLLLSDKGFKFEKAHPFIINNKKECIDIDTEKDWKIAEAYLKKK